MLEGDVKSDVTDLLHLSMTNQRFVKLLTSLTLLTNFKNLTSLANITEGYVCRSQTLPSNISFGDVKVLESDVKSLTNL